jgi:polysaccharide chain length determinant protein (PEP-CTERM system associated)
MLPGKLYTPDDYLRMAWSRRWFILIPTVVIASTTAVVAMFLPNVYRASTNVMIVPQRVPEEFVQSTVTNPLAERLDMVSKQILSRTQLERIIQEFNLYERERGQMIMEDVIERMRRDIRISLSTNPRRRERTASFSVSFDSPNARTAMRVTERLGSLFVQENLEDRQLLADQTAGFLQAQLEEARRRLQDQENKLRDFRQRNHGQLPEQVQANLQLMSGAETRLQSVLEAQNRDRDRLANAEKTLLELGAPTTVTAPAPAATKGSEGPATAAELLALERAKLRGLELRLKPEHPDIGIQKRLIAELETKAEEEALRQPLSAVNPAPVVTVNREVAARIDRVRSEIQDLRSRIESGRREEVVLRDTITRQQARVATAPGLQSQLTDLMRDYTTVQETYTSLLRRAEESRLSVNMERRQIGEQFKIIDGARLPERPISPDRSRINMFGILGGLAVGLALVALLEYRDTSFKTDDDVMTTLALPVLAVIPLMTNAGERRQTRRRKLLLAASASLTCMLLAAAVMVVWQYQLLDRWR